MTLPDKNAKNHPLGWDAPNLMQHCALQTYVVNPGDTFKSIAKRLYGDTHGASKIASANGYTMSIHALKPGLVLRIPQYIASRSHAGVTRPEQDFSKVLLGTLSPPMEAPLPTQIPLQPVYLKPKRNFWKMAIKIIAIAAVCIAAPHLAPFLLTPAIVGALGAMLSTMVATGVVAAIGDAAVQGLAIKIGAQEKFSFSEVLETGVTAGIGASTTGVKSASDLAINTLKVTMGTVGIELGKVMTGKTQKLDMAAIFTQVAASVVAAKMNQGLDSVVGNSTGAVSKMARGVATTTTNTLLGNGITHTPVDMQSLAANAMGSAVGSGLDHAWPSQGKNPSAGKGSKGSATSHAASNSRQRVETKSSHQTNSTRERRYGHFFNESASGSRTPESKRLESKHPQTKDYVDGFIGGVEAGRDALVHAVKHPIDAAAGAATLAWDGSNAIGNKAFGISTAGARQRNLVRGAAINQGIDDFVHASGPARTKMIAEAATTAIYGGALGAGAVGVGRLGVRVVTNMPTMFGNIKKSDIQLLHHSKIKFSQSSVNNIDVITKSMQTHGWKGPPIDIVKLPNGTLVSVDNTRLLAASRANIPVKANIHDFNKPLTQEIAERFTTKQGGIPSTWGDAVQNRIGKQSNIYQNTYPNGSCVIGAI